MNDTFIGPHPPNDGRDWDCCCARCGSTVTFERCDSCGGDGVVEVYEEDPLNNDPGDVEGCETCSGAGGWRTCLASAEWCEANPRRSRIHERGVIEWWTRKEVA